MRYELSLIIRSALAITILLIPINIFQEYLTDIIFQIIYRFLEYAQASPKTGVYGVHNAIVIFGDVGIYIVKNCVTSGAYYFLALLTILAKDVGIIKRILMFIIGSFLIFLMNLARIVVLITSLLSNWHEYFSLLHMIFWFLLSIVYVIVIWVLMSRAFKIKTIPVYSDIKYLIENIRK